jgi:biopolymer transport protein ExbD
MRIGTPIPHKKARLEIIPLIDVMFFLLASFMLVSMTMLQLRSLKMSLPTAAAARPGLKPDMINLRVDALGDVFVEKNRTSRPDLWTTLTNRFASDTNLSVYITGDAEATHGVIIDVLDFVRQSGVSKVAFNIAPEGTGGSPAK